MAIDPDDPDFGQKMLEQLKRKQQEAEARRRAQEEEQRRNQR